MLEQKIDQPEIESERLRLRPLRHSDAGLLAHHTGQEQLARMTTSIPHPLPPGATEGFIAAAQAADRSKDIWVMDGAHSGLAELVGVIALDRMDREQSEIGYWVAPAFWNARIASEAVGAMVAANPHAARTLFASVFQDNPASARVLTNAGFQYLGDAESFSVARGAPVSTWTYLRKIE